MWGSNHHHPFGHSSNTPFGSSTFQHSQPAFASSSIHFGSQPAAGPFTTTRAFGSVTTPAFGASSTPAFGSTSSPAFGQSTSAFGALATTPSFGGQQQHNGSRVAAYSPTSEVDNGTSQAAGKLESVSAMPLYKDKSHEELRWEDYQLGDKGGQSPAAAQSAGGATGFGGATNTQSNPSATSSTFGQSSANPFSSTTPSNNPFASKPSPFGSSTTATFGSSLFSTSSTSNPFGSAAQAPGTTSVFVTASSFGNTQSSQLFQSTTPSSPGQTNPIFGQTGSSCAQTTPSFFGQSNIFSTPSTGDMFSTPALRSIGNFVGFGQMTSAQPDQTAGSFGLGIFGHTQSARTSGFGGIPSIFDQSTFGQLPSTQSSVVAQPISITNPFGTLPAMPQMSIGRSGISPSVQYGISNLTVIDKPAPVRISPLLSSRHLSQRRIRLPARKYHPNNDGPKGPFFTDDQELSSTPKADALFIHRDNPRALLIRPLEQWPRRTSPERSSPLQDMTPNYENGSSVFGQKPAFGGFGSNTAQPSPFGNTFQQSQPAFRNNRFGASSQPAFAASSTPAFGSVSTPAFGAARSPSSGATSTSAFGSTPISAFGSKGSAFGVSSAPVFGSGGAFGVSNTPAFGASSSPAFGGSSTPAFGASSAPSFSFGPIPAFGQSISAFGTSMLPFGAQNSTFGSQATTPSFGSSGFGQAAFGGQQRGRSKVAAYSPTPEADSGTSQPAGKLESVSAMPVYKDKSHEELRWEDYQWGDKGKVSGVVPTSLNGFKAADKDKEPAENGKQVVSANSSHIPNGVEKWWESPCWRAGAAAALVFEHGAAIGALVPKLRHSYYYTEPRLQKLAVKERAEPGYCCRVKDFVVGRYGYGSIRFIGETDVRGLDVESIVQFNSREVIVYMDETKKPPVGQGLNKPAEVTLLKIKWFDKKTGLQYTEGPKIIKYINMLKRKAEDQGAKFVSYDAIKGEWKFRVDHCSTYGIGSEDEEENHCIVPVY